MLQIVRRAAVLVAAPVLAASAVVATSAPARAAEPDPAPVDAGAEWLRSQLTDGVIHNEQYDFDDLGLSVDVALSLTELGDDVSVAAISSAIEPQVRNYYTYAVTAEKTHVSAGSLAKSVALALAAGADPASYGEQNLVGQLEERVSAQVGSAGRISDVFFPEEPFEEDFANTIGQSFAARALAETGSAQVGAVTDYLLLQQCAAGYFRLDLGATQTDTCDADAAAASTDVTALAVLNLRSQAGDEQVQTAVDAATAWLKSSQRADGSFGSDGQITTPNANSTGLAGWALGFQGETGPAEKAATWLRRHQADDFGPCTTGLTAETGAIGYDDAAFAAGRKNGIVPTTQDQFRRATAQALPALQWAPAGGLAVEPVSSAKFVKAGSQVTLHADDVAPGQAVCFARGASQALVHADATGHARGVVTLPSGTGNRVYSVGLASGVLGKITVRALDKKTLKLTPARKAVAKGAKIKVKVAGLAARESVKVTVNGTKVDAGKANAKGVFVASFKATGKPGKRTVKAVGAFAFRAGKATFKVVR